MTILDHITLVVSDYGRSRTFYEKALAPLGIQRILEFGQACGFGKNGKAAFSIGAGPASFRRRARPTTRLAMRGHRLALGTTRLTTIEHRRARRPSRLATHGHGLTPWTHRLTTSAKPLARWAWQRATSARRRARRADQHATSAHWLARWSRRLA